MERNIEYSQKFIEFFLPKVKLYKPEGLFMIWLDCTELNLKYSQLEELFIHKAKLAPTFGKVFGDKYQNFVRLNLGCSFSRWKEIMDRLKYGIESFNIISLE